MNSRDFDLAGSGTLRILSGAVSARGDVVLSRELTAQAGVDLRRYAQEDGRVIIPTTISGTLQQPQISLDILAAARRALDSEALATPPQVVRRGSVQEEEMRLRLACLRARNCRNRADDPSARGVSPTVQLTALLHQRTAQLTEAWTESSSWRRLTH